MALRPWWHLTVVCLTAQPCSRCGAGTVSYWHSPKLKTGERFAYSMAAVAHLRAAGLPIATVWYDVGDGRVFSAMSRFLELRGVRPVLRAMHARMHTVTCCVRWEGAAAPGVGDPLSELSEHKKRALALVCLGRKREVG